MTKNNTDHVHIRTKFKKDDVWNLQFSKLQPWDYLFIYLLY